MGNQENAVNTNTINSVQQTYSVPLRIRLEYPIHLAHFTNAEPISQNIENINIEYYPQENGINYVKYMDFTCTDYGSIVINCIDVFSDYLSGDLSPNRIYIDKDVTISIL